MSDCLSDAAKSARPPGYEDDVEEKARVLYISDIANNVKDLNRWQVAMDNCTDVNGHVVLAERLIQELKESMRSVIHSLSFRLSMKLLDFLVTYVTVRRNSVFNKSLGSKISPREIFTGRKIDYKKELAQGFGDYAKVYNTQAKKNTMDKRA